MLSTYALRYLTTRAGVVLPAVQAAIAAKGRSATSTRSRIHIKDIADLHNDAGQALYPEIYKNLQMYQEVVEPNVDEMDRAFASNVRRDIENIVKKSQETARELHAACSDKRSKAEDLRDMELKLEIYARHLFNYQGCMNSRLLLLQQPGPEGKLACVPKQTEQPEEYGITLSSNVRPIEVSYDADKELEWAVSKRDAALLGSLFDTQETNAEPTSRPSVALLLACRERLPDIVKLCLDYSADPAVTGDDGLGAIHNAIGTADVMLEPPEIVDILTLLIRQGVKASARDFTKEQLRPLHRAAITKNVSATRFLLEKDPDMVNLVDAEGKTALYQACLTPNQKVALVEELLNKNADFAGKPRPPMPDHDGQLIARCLDERKIE